MNENKDEQHQPDVDIKKIVADVHGQFNKFAGLEKLEGFSMKKLAWTESAKE